MELLPYEPQHQARRQERQDPEDGRLPAGRRVRLSHTAMDSLLGDVKAQWQLLVIKDAH
jgi:hypothetical protein